MEPKKYFYYINDPDTGKKRVTVCILKSGEKIARGIAICSDYEPYCDCLSGIDQFNKKLGRTIAEGRAWKAYRSQNADMGNRVENPLAVHAIPAEFFSICKESVSKSEWMPALTEYEKSIIK